MTLPEGRQPIEAQDMAKLHPLTWAQEVEALRRDYGLMKTDRNNLRSLLDEAEDKADKLHDKLEDAQSEAKALRARVAELEAGIKCALGCLDDPTGGTCVTDARKAQIVLREALDVTDQPFCAALQQPTEPPHSAKSNTR